MVRFNFQRDSNDGFLHTVCGVSETEATVILKAIEEVFLDSLDYTNDEPLVREGIEIGERIEVLISPLEMAQAAAENLNIDLTPEVGFYIAMVIQMELNNTSKYSALLTKKRRGS